MSSIQILPIRTPRARKAFLTFPWTIYHNDPLWVPPLLKDRAKAIDPASGVFFKDGIAECFLALRDGKPAGTLCLAEEKARTRHTGHAECMFGFVEFIEDYSVFRAMFEYAGHWSAARGMTALYGPYNLDREDARGILLEGRDRPPALLCGHHPPYYRHYFEQYGFQKMDDDSVAYAVDIDLENPRIQKLARVAERVRRKNPNFHVRSANWADIDAEIDRIVDLQNRGLGHFEGHVPYTRTDIEAMIMPILHLVDAELVLFAEVDGKPAGFFPGVPNFNEVLIHLNGLRYPWDYLRALRHRNDQPKCIAIKSIVVAPEYWETGLSLLLFDEMAKRAAARGYHWADLSLTGETNPDTRPLAVNMGARVYKRYRLYRMEITQLPAGVSTPGI
jgi:GNAT superfamily N-acetyltransferase